MIEIGPNLMEAIKAVAFVVGIVGALWTISKIFNGE
jgi:hypothetical protein